MQTNGPKPGDAMERLNLREQAWPLYLAAQVLGVVGLVATVLLGYFADDEFQAVLLFVSDRVPLLSVDRAGRAVFRPAAARDQGRLERERAPHRRVVRIQPADDGGPLGADRHRGRAGRGQLYPWAAPGWVNKGFKGFYLNPPFFICRLAFYFVVWSMLGVWYWKQSVTQDDLGGITLTLQMQWWAPLGLILFGLTLTFAMWDWIMSLDPGWYSTIFGVYYFAGSALAIFASLVLTVRLLQSRGLLLNSVTVEHYHDLGKFLFGFTFFWGYIAFSQYMLQWYGNIPDETEWFVRHGASTAHPNAFSPVAIALLFGHFLIPFAGLLSRHVKRNPAALTFWAVWVLAFCWLDMFWLVMPQFDNGKLHFGLIDLAAFVGIGGVFVAFVVRKASHDSVRAMRDPRLADSLAFENI